MNTMIGVFLSLSTIVMMGQAEKLPVRMDGIIPTENDQYLCTSVPVDDPSYIVGFQPHGDSHSAHHILLFGCSTPGMPDGEVWNCGEMSGHGGDFEQSPVCQNGNTILYGWAKDAPRTNLPKDVGFKVGGDSGINHLVVQVHYMHKLNQPDYSGLTLNLTQGPIGKRAGVLLMVTGGEMEPQSTENFETACLIDEPITLHPFAFRTHSHNHGVAISGYRVRKDYDNNGAEEDKWTLIGKKNPQLPQMFYPVQDTVDIHEGDIVAARCHMKNEEDRAVAVGATGKDEMCNFYMMYYVDGDKILEDNTCFSPGPPTYHWDTEGGLNNIPTDANTA